MYLMHIHDNLHVSTENVIIMICQANVTMNINFCDLYFLSQSLTNIVYVSDFFLHV